MPKEITNEEFAAASQDANGGGAFIQEPVATGDAHLNRGADNLDAGDRDTVVVPGVGEVPKAAQLKALLMKLSTLPPEILAQIANEIDANSDVEQNPSASTDGMQAGNLASISVKEDIEDMFKGETISEEFKERASVIFEAALGARAVVMRAEIEEAHQQEVETVVESVTNTLVESIDKYLSYAAENYIDENKVEIDASIEATIAEQFMQDVYEVAKKYKIEVPVQNVDVVESLSTQVADLTAKVDAQLNENIELANRIKEYEKKEIVNTVSEGLALTQRERLINLSENVEYESIDDFKHKVEILKENVIAKPSAPKQIVADGVPLMENEQQQKVVSNDPIVRETMKLLTGGRAA